jgi:hypothetical protein
VGSVDSAAGRERNMIEARSVPENDTITVGFDQVFRLA